MVFVMFFFSSRRRHTRCLSDWSSDVCSSDLKLATTLDNLGQLLQRRHRLEEAEKFHDEALAMYREKLPEGHPDIGIALHNLAALRVGQGNLKGAEALLAESLKIMRKALSVEVPARTQVLVDLAAVL